MGNSTEPLRGQIALVTGAGSEAGIGFATARRLATMGARVFITSTTDRCHQRAKTLVTEGFEVDAFAADLMNAAQVDALVARVHDVLGPIALLVNNAGMTSVLDPMDAMRRAHELGQARWSHIIERNLSTCFAVTARVLPDMLHLGRGRIVNVASTTGVTGAMLGESAYAAAKAGVAGFTRAVALEYAAHGITANAVAPGWIATGSQTTDEALQGQASPVGRSGTPDEVAHIIAMLCAPDAGYVTGQCLVVDGGNAIAEERRGR